MYCAISGPTWASTVYSHEFLSNIWRIGSFFRLWTSLTVRQASGWVWKKKELEFLVWRLSKKLFQIVKKLDFVSVVNDNNNNMLVGWKNNIKKNMFKLELFLPAYLICDYAGAFRFYYSMESKYKWLCVKSIYIRTMFLLFFLCFMKPRYIYLYSFIVGERQALTQ